jgi:hypothetical protein
VDDFLDAQGPDAGTVCSQRPRQHATQVATSRTAPVGPVARCGEADPECPSKAATVAVMSLKKTGPLPLTLWPPPAPVVVPGSTLSPDRRCAVLLRVGKPCGQRLGSASPVTSLRAWSLLGGCPAWLRRFLPGRCCSLQQRSSGNGRASRDPASVSNGRGAAIRSETQSTLPLQPVPP